MLLLGYARTDSRINCCRGPIWIRRIVRGYGGSIRVRHEWRGLAQPRFFAC
jgi:hypothetical protein